MSYIHFLMAFVKLLTMNCLTNKNYANKTTNILLYKRQLLYTCIYALCVCVCVCVCVHDGHKNKFNNCQNRLKLTPG